jgi:hypothetical protein
MCGRSLIAWRPGTAFRSLILPSLVHVVWYRAISVDVLSRAMYSPLNGHVLIFDGEFLRVCTRALRAFELCKQIRGT